VPTWNPTAENPSKSVSVAGSVSRPWRVPPLNGSVTSGGPGAQTWMTGGSSMPPGIGFGGTASTRVCVWLCAKPGVGYASDAPTPAAAPRKSPRRLKVTGGMNASF
jgi:hypothetical protein